MAGAGGDEGLGRRAGVAGGRIGAAREGGEELADRPGVGGDRVLVGDEDELVVGRDAEPVDGDDPGVEAALGEIDALDVQEAAEHGVGASCDQRLHQVEADVDLVDRVGIDPGAVEDRSGRGCRR